MTCSLISCPKLFDLIWFTPIDLLGIRLDKLSWDPRKVCARATTCDLKSCVKPMLNYRPFRPWLGWFMLGWWAPSAVWQYPVLNNPSWLFFAQPHPRKLTAHVKTLNQGSCPENCDWHRSGFNHLVTPSLVSWFVRFILSHFIHVERRYLYKFFRIYVHRQYSESQVVFC